MSKDINRLHRLIYQMSLLFDKQPSITQQIQKLRASSEPLDKVKLSISSSYEDIVNIFEDSTFWDKVGKPIDTRLLRNNHIFHAVRRSPVVSNQYVPISTYVIVEDAIGLGLFPIRYDYGPTPRRTLDKGSKPTLLTGFNDHRVVLAFYGAVLQSEIKQMYENFAALQLVPNILVSNSHLGNSACKLQILLQGIDYFGHGPRNDKLPSMEVVIPESLFGISLSHRWIDAEDIKDAIVSIRVKLDALLQVVTRLQNYKMTAADREQIESKLYEFFFRERTDVSVTFIDRQQVAFSEMTSAWSLLKNLYSSIVDKGIVYQLLPNETRKKKRLQSLQVYTQRKELYAQRHQRFTERLFEIFYELLGAIPVWGFFGTFTFANK